VGRWRGLTDKPMSDPAEQGGPLRVLQMIPSLAAGGAERQLALLVRSADRTRVRYGVCFFLSGLHSEEVRSATEDVWHLPRRRRSSPSVPLGLARVVREFRPHVVHTWLPYMDIVGALVVRLTSRIPVLVSERNSRIAHQNSDFQNLIKVWNFCRRHLATAAIANSEGGREYLEQDVRFRAPVAVVKNGLDLEAIDAAPPADVAAFRRDGGPLLLHCGRLDPQKNVGLLLRALPEIAAARPNARLLLCGSGHKEGELRDLARSLGVEAITEWLGVRSDVPSLMKACDLLVHPALAEGDPNVLAEAGAARLPLCVSDIGPHHEFAGGACCAAFFDPHRPEDLARSVLEVLSDAAARERRVGEARVVSESRSARRMAEQYEAVYRRFARR
jgi:glycosyltransferase involved in cell wall biosynthesis